MLHNGMELSRSAPTLISSLRVILTIEQAFIERHSLIGMALILFKDGLGFWIGHDCQGIGQPRIALLDKVENAPKRPSSKRKVPLAYCNNLELSSLTHLSWPYDGKQVATSDPGELGLGRRVLPLRTLSPGSRRVHVWATSASQSNSPSMSNNRSARNRASRSAGRSGWNLLKRPRGRATTIVITRSAEKKPGWRMESNAPHRSRSQIWLSADVLTVSVILSPSAWQSSTMDRHRARRMFMRSPAKV